MALTTDQINQLVTAFPYASIDDWVYADRRITDATGLDTSATFSTILDYANTSYRTLQYLLEESDEVLFNMATRLSGQQRPAANTYADIETASSIRTVIASVTLVNTSATDDTVRLCHVKASGTAGDSNTIFEGQVPGSPSGQLGISLNLPLQSGEKLSIRSLNGTTTFNSYVY